MFVLYAGHMRRIQQKVTNYVSDTMTLIYESNLTAGEEPEMNFDGRFHSGSE